MLEACPECTKPVSSEVDACPHCGYLVKGREFLVTCVSCKNEVIPENSHDLYQADICPICQELTEEPTKVLSLIRGFGTILFFTILAIFAWVIFFE